LGGLEKQISELGVESYGVSVTTLEVVFLKVASGEAFHNKAAASSAQDNGESSDYVELTEITGAEDPPQGSRAAENTTCGTTSHETRDEVGGELLTRKPTGHALCQDSCVFCCHIWALFRKRVRYGMRDRKGFFCQLCLPVLSLVVFLALISAKLFHSNAPLELDARLYNTNCPGVPQNVVDYTHLASIRAEEAAAALEPGKQFWNGDLQYFEPPSEGGLAKLEEQALASSIPGFLSHKLIPILRASEDPREVAKQLLQDDQLPSHVLTTESDGSALGNAKARVAALLGDLWATVAKAHHASRTADAMMADAGHPTVAARRLMSVLQRVRAASPNRSSVSKDAEGPTQHVQWLPLRFSSTCMQQSTLEIFMWQHADLDGDDRLSKQEVYRTVHEVMQVMDRSASSQASSVHEQMKVEEVIVAALFLAFDREHTGYISKEEFCKIGASVHAEIQRIRALGERFSKQILSSNAECARYGAFYLISPPRSKTSPEWAAGADAVMYVNTTSSHASGVFQSVLTNTHLARMNSEKRVLTNVHPFPQTKYDQNNLEKMVFFLLAIYITFSLSFIPSGIVNFVVKERASGAQQLQVLSGSSRLSYWLANLLYDLMLYIFPAICVPITLQRYGFNMMLAGESGIVLGVVLCVFGPAVAGFSYLVSFLFKDHSKAANSILTFSLFGAIVLSTILFILDIINFDMTSEYPLACDHPTDEFPEGHCNSPKARLADRILGPLFRFVPTVCLYEALFAVAIMANILAVLPDGALEAMMSVSGGPKISMSPWAYEWAGEPLLYLTCDSIGFFVLVVILDTALHSPRIAKFLDAASWFLKLSKWWARNSEARASPLITGSCDDTGDAGVDAERERTALVSPEDIALRVFSLEKVYRNWLSFRTPPKHAVRGVSFCVRGGEVFGLLGHNGAGKTSTLKCLVGEQHCTVGDVHVGGFHMERESGKARHKIGYCPQFDALNELLTVQDHMELFCALKSMPAQLATHALSSFGLQNSKHRRADNLSGGNKRKLSAAIALTGGPSLVVLDEPSCGLDPAARRALWSAVHAAVAGFTTNFGPTCVNLNASAVLLTTHSMEEAEALSNRLGILSDGRLLTVGTAQQIKQRYGGSHELCCTLAPETDDQLKSTLQVFGGGTLQPQTLLDYRSIEALLDANPNKKSAYLRPRCMIRGQIESVGLVEASVLAEWWLLEQKGESIQAFLCQVLGDGVDLAENFGVYWRFRLSHSGIGLPQLFNELETKGKDLGIAEYTLTQATLEQIFNSMAKESDQERENIMQ